MQILVNLVTWNFDLEFWILCVLNSHSTIMLEARSTFEMPLLAFATKSIFESVMELLGQVAK